MAFGTQSAKIRTATTWEPSTNMVLYIVERSISMKITLLFIRVQSSLSVSIALVCSFCVLSCASLLPTLSFRIGLSSGTFRFNHQVNAIVHSISYKKSNLFFFWQRSCIAICCHTFIHSFCAGLLSEQKSWCILQFVITWISQKAWMTELATFFPSQ